MAKALAREIYQGLFKRIQNTSARLPSPEMGASDASIRTVKGKIVGPEEPIPLRKNLVVGSKHRELEFEFSQTLPPDIRTDLMKSLTSLIDTKGEIQKLTGQSIQIDTGDIGSGHVIAELSLATKLTPRRPFNSRDIDLMFGEGVIQIKQQLNPDKDRIHAVHLFGPLAETRTLLKFQNFIANPINKIRITRKPR